jgi:phage-related protein
MDPVEIRFDVVFFGQVQELSPSDGATMILLHGFIKKTRKIPPKEINTARSRLRQYQEVGS